MTKSVRDNQVFCFGLLWLGYCASYLIRKPLGVIKTVLGPELRLTPTQLGLLDTAFVLPYALVQIGLPGLSDQFGAKPVLVTCLLLAALVSFTSSLCQNFASLSATLFVTGVCLAPAWPSCSNLLARLFQKGHQNFFFGVLSTATFAGGLGGTAISAVMLDNHGWRSVFWVPSLFTGITAILLLLIRIPSRSQKDVTDETSSTEGGKHEDTPVAAKRSLYALLTIHGVKELALVMFCLKFVRYVMYMWLPLYMLQHLGLSKLQAGLFSTVFDVGGIVGSPVVGFLLDHFFPNSTMKGVTITLLIGALSLAVLIPLSAWSLLMSGVLLFLTGATNCGLDGLLSGSISMQVGEQNGQRSGAGVTSLVNGVGNVGGMVEGPLIGLLLHQFGWLAVLPVLFGVTTSALLLSFYTYTHFKRLSLSVS